MTEDDKNLLSEPPTQADDTPSSGVRRLKESTEITPPSGIRVTSTASAVRAEPVAPAPASIPTRARLPLLNWLISSAAAAITLLAAVLYLQQDTRSAPQPTAAPTRAATGIESTPVPSAMPPTPVSPQPVRAADSSVPVDVLAELLMHPASSAPPADSIFRMQVAYTIAPVRTRSGVIQYQIQPGDTLDKIAARFGLSTDTLVWNNSIVVNRLQPGDMLTILPENGVLHKTNAEETIQAIADKYKVTPYTIIDSEYNPRLQNATPTTLIPPGQNVIVPGGVSEKKAVYWNPGTQRRDRSGRVFDFADSAGVGSNAEGEISFGGGPGSCGFQPNGAGTGRMQVPLGGYQVVRGFSAAHSGIDLSAPIGAPVFAADGGRVIFAGWSNWGYGNSIVLAHGTYLTLYGHLSRINVSCGQNVGKGALIGAVGNTGVSSGPHLHFEVRPGGIPVDPYGYLSF